MCASCRPRFRHRIRFALRLRPPRPSRRRTKSFTRHNHRCHNHRARRRAFLFGRTHARQRWGRYDVDARYLCVTTTTAGAAGGWFFRERRAGPLSSSPASRSRMRRRSRPRRSVRPTPTSRRRRPRRPTPARTRGRWSRSTRTMLSCPCTRFTAMSFRFSKAAKSFCCFLNALLQVQRDVRRPRRQQQVGVEQLAPHRQVPILQPARESGHEAPLEHRIHAPGRGDVQGREARGGRRVHLGGFFFEYFFFVILGAAGAAAPPRRRGRRRPTDATSPGASSARRGLSPRAPLAAPRPGRATSDR